MGAIFLGVLKATATEAPAGRLWRVLSCLLPLLRLGGCFKSPPLVLRRFQSKSLKDGCRSVFVRLEHLGEFPSAYLASSGCGSDPSVEVQAERSTRGPFPPDLTHASESGPPRSASCAALPAFGAALAGGRFSSTLGGVLLSILSRARSLISRASSSTGRSVGLQELTCEMARASGSPTGLTTAVAAVDGTTGSGRLC
jgi:hypothetical protein